MSQAGVLTVNTSGGAVTETLTGNSGGAVGPDGAFNINIVGNNTNGINVIGNPGTNTLTVTAFQATTTQEGTITLATNAQSIAGTDAANAITAAALGAKLGTQTAHSLALFEGTNAALVPLGVATNGQIPIGSTGADPVLATITAGTGVTVTNAAGSITISADNTHVLETLTGNSGGAISPTVGNINTLGTGSITIAGTGSTLTTQLTGLTNHALQIGAGTATLTQLGPGSASGQILQTNAAADPTWSTATYPSTASTSGTLLRATGTNWQATASTYPSTNAINTLLYASAANTMSALATGNNGILITGTTGTPSILAAGTTGQVLTATTGSPAAWASPAASSITITGNSGGGLTGNSFTFTGGTTGLTFSGATTTETLGGTLGVANGGTGNTTFTAYSVIIAGTTATGVFQNVVGVGTTGQVLTSNGAAALPTWQTAGGGSGITTINGDSGSITGTTVTIKSGVSTQNCGSSVEFVNTGTTSTLNVTDANANTLIGLTSGNATLSGTTNNSLGSLALKSLTNGSSNNAFGYQALTSLTTGNTNTAVGQQALESLVSNSSNSAFGYGVLQNCTGSNNTSVGQQSTKNITSGSNNCALGSLAGNSLATTDSSNINIMNTGTAGDNNTTRIGTQGTGAGQQNICFIAGITGATVTGSAVLCSSAGQLGTIASSIRFKEQIETVSIDKGFMSLRPVKFKYKDQKNDDTHYGLIAEEVEKVFPDLVLYDDNQKPSSVKYHEMPALLLAEIQKLRNEIDELKALRSK